MAARSWGLERIARGSRSSTRSGFRSPASRTVPASPPARTSRSVRAISSTETPFSAAFSWSVTKTSFLRRRFDRVVDLRDPRLDAKTPGHRAGGGDQVVVGVVRPAVDLGHQRGEHRRARRQLDDLEPRVVSLGQRRQAVVQPQRDGVALRVAVLLADEVDPHLGVVRHLPQVVVPHQAVEVDRAGRPT